MTMDADDYADTLREQRMADIARSYAEQFVEYVLQEATDHGEFDGVRPEDAVVDLLHGLSGAGYRLSTDSRTDDEMNVEVFAGPNAYYTLSSEFTEWTNRRSTDVDQIEIHGVTVQLDPALPDDVLIAVHMGAIAPTPPSSQKSWVVRSSEGVRTMRIPDVTGGTEP